MSKTVCQAKKNGEVKERGRATIEWHDKDGKPQYYCYGYIDADTEELTKTCRKCADHVNNVDEDCKKYYLKSKK